MEIVEKNKFADSIYETINKVNKEKGYKLFNSVIIAQSVLETGWGQSNIMMKANALFGIKAGTGWKGKVYSSSTLEIYDGVEKTELATFRAYNNIEESIRDYYSLIETNYKNALKCNSQKESIEAIKNGGYATDPDYVNKIMSIINANEFINKYDINNVDNKYKIGRYIVDVKEDEYLNVRKNSGIDSKILKFEELTENAQKQIIEKIKPGGLVKGVEVDISEIVYQDGYHFGKIPSGWIALEYCKKG